MAVRTLPREGVAKINTKSIPKYSWEARGNVATSSLMWVRAPVGVRWAQIHYNLLFARKNMTREPRCCTRLTINRNHKSTQQIRPKRRDPGPTQVRGTYIGPGTPLFCFSTWVYEYSMLRNSASGPEISLLGRILAGLLPGKHPKRPSGRPKAVLF